MAGYGARKKQSKGVRQDLYVKALALEDQTGKTAVLITLDRVEIGREQAGVIAERCQKQFGLTRDRLVLNVSHTHSGPVIGTPPAYADVNQNQAQVIRRYTAALLEKVVGAIGASIQNLAPATLMGITSQGMVLAAEAPDGRIVLLLPDREVPPGSPVK